MFSDVLPTLASLSRAFQKHDVHFTVVKPLVVGTKSAVDTFLTTPGEFFNSLPTVLLELEEYGVKQPTDAMVTEFKSSIYDKYLCTLSRSTRARTAAQSWE